MTKKENDQESCQEPASLLDGNGQLSTQDAICESGMNPAPPALPILERTHSIPDSLLPRQIRGSGRFCVPYSPSRSGLQAISQPPPPSLPTSCASSRSLYLQHRAGSIAVWKGRDRGRIGQEQACTTISLKAPHVIVQSPGEASADQGHSEERQRSMEMILHSRAQRAAERAMSLQMNAQRSHSRSGHQTRRSRKGGDGGPARQAVPSIDINAADEHGIDMRMPEVVAIDVAIGEHGAQTPTDCENLVSSRKHSSSRVLQRRGYRGHSMEGGRDGEEGSVDAGCSARRVSSCDPAHFVPRESDTQRQPRVCATDLGRSSEAGDFGRAVEESPRLTQSSYHAGAALEPSPAATRPSLASCLVGQQAATLKGEAKIMSETQTQTSISSQSSQHVSERVRAWLETAAAGLPPQAPSTTIGNDNPLVVHAQGADKQEASPVPASRADQPSPLRGSYDGACGMAERNKRDSAGTRKTRAERACAWNSTKLGPPEASLPQGRSVRSSTSPRGPRTVTAVYGAALDEVVSRHQSPSSRYCSPRSPRESPLSRRDGGRGGRRGGGEGEREQEAVMLARQFPALGVLGDSALELARLKIRYGLVEDQVGRAGRSEDGELNEHLQGVAARNIGGESVEVHKIERTIGKEGRVEGQRAGMLLSTEEISSKQAEAAAKGASGKHDAANNRSELLACIRRLESENAQLERLNQKYQKNCSEQDPSSDDVEASCFKRQEGEPVLEISDAHSTTGGQQDGKGGGAEDEASAEVSSDRFFRKHRDAGGRVSQGSHLGRKQAQRQVLKAYMASDLVAVESHDFRVAALPVTAPTTESDTALYENRGQRDAAVPAPQECNPGSVGSYPSAAAELVAPGSAPLRLSKASVTSQRTQTEQNTSTPRSLTGSEVEPQPQVCRAVSFAVSRSPPAILPLSFLTSL